MRSRLRDAVVPVITCLLLAIAAFGMGACSNQDSAEAPSSEQGATTPVLADCPIGQDVDYGGVYINVGVDEFNKLGFAFGDSVDVAFSNGYEMHDIPYYNGYYVSVGDPLLIGYPGAANIEAKVNYGDSLWTTAELSEGDSATVTICEAGKYRDVQEAFETSYSNERGDYANLDDAGFANFRPVVGGEIKAGAVYRSSSPIDNKIGRAAYVEVAMEDAGVAYVLDLADTAEEVDGALAASKEAGVDVSYFERLREQELVGELGLDANYMSQDFTKTLVDGLVAMSEHDGPYLVHCLEGKDRTGFVCVLLEALSGASYDELLSDYMATYDNYYGITRESDPKKFEAIAHLNLDGMLYYLAECDEGNDLTEIDFTYPAARYLQSGGMTDEQIDALLTRITR